jgi:hypothetical protein
MLTPLFNNLIDSKTRPFVRESWPALRRTPFQDLREATGFAQRRARSWTNCDPRCIGRRIRCRTTLE